MLCCKVIKIIDTCTLCVLACIKSATGQWAFLKKRKCTSIIILSEMTYEVRIST